VAAIDGLESMAWEELAGGLQVLAGHELDDEGRPRFFQEASAAAHYLELDALCIDLDHVWRWQLERVERLAADGESRPALAREPTSSAASSVSNNGAASPLATTNTP